MRCYRIPALVTALFFALSPVFAQTPPEAGEEREVASNLDLRKPVNIDADDASLPTVLSILAAESGYNIVTGPGVNKEEKISIHLENTPIEEAMNLVVRAAGLAYEVVGNSFLIASANKLKTEVGLRSYVIELLYANAEEVAALLKDFNAQIQVDVAGNKLLIITSPKVISEIRSVIAAVDLPALQIMLEARVIEVAVEDEEKLGIQWNKLTPFETVVYEGTETPNPFRPKELPQQVPFLQIEDLNTFGNFGYQEPVFQLAIDYLLKNNLAEVLANSQIATMNNREASIEVVDRIPFVLSAGGVGGQVRTQTEEVGVKLHIKPTVNTEGNITVQITPEVSNVFQLIGPDQNIPWVVSRRATTTIRVKDGQSIIIAGLLGVNRKNTLFKVPFLGDIPFIGGLFRHKSMTSKKTDLIIQITPHIINELDTGIVKSKLIRSAEEHAMRPTDFDTGEEAARAERAAKAARAEEAAKAKAEKKKMKEKQPKPSPDEDLELLKESLQQGK